MSYAEAALMFFSLTRSYSRNGEDPVSNKLAIFFKHCNPQWGQCRKDHLVETHQMLKKTDPTVCQKNTFFCVTQSYLIKDKHFIIPNWVQWVPIRGLGSVLPLCISRQTEHVHFHVGTDFFICQELAWDHLVEVWWWNACVIMSHGPGRGRLPPFPPWLYLDFDGVGDYPVHSGVRERVKVLVRPPHELRFQQIAAAPVVFKHAHIELHRQVWQGEQRDMDEVICSDLPHIFI